MPHVARPCRSVPVEKSPIVETPLLLAPRTCNTGALIPQDCGFDYNSYKIDWLEMTVVGLSWQDFAVVYLGLDPKLFVHEEFGRHGYADLRTYGNVQLCSTDTCPDRGTKCILPATALDQVAYDACYIIKKGLQDGASFARIDLAYDDFSGTLSFDRLNNAILSTGELVTRFRSVEPKCPLWLSGDRKNQRSGEGFVFGSGSSARQLVAYNKKLEQEYKAIKSNNPLPRYAEGFTWWRIEGRWRKSAALNLAAEIAENGLKNGGALLRGLIDFRDPDSNVKQDRRLVSKWWAKLLSHGDIIRTGIQKPVKTVEEKSQWLMKSCRKAMGQVATILGAELLSEIMLRGAQDTTEKEWQRLRASSRTLAFDRITFADGCPF